jgi:hypothetical protein
MRGFVLVSVVSLMVLVAETGRAGEPSPERVAGLKATLSYRARQRAAGYRRRAEFGQQLMLYALQQERMLAEYIKNNTADYQYKYSTDGTYSVQLVYPNGQVFVEERDSKGILSRTVGRAQPK